VSKSTFEGFTPKDAAQKTEFFFAYVISRKQSANQQKLLCNDAPHVKTSQSAKNQLDPAKKKNRPKMPYMPF